MYLKDKENHNIGRIYGLKRNDFFQLKSQFNSLRLCCLTYVEKIKKDYIHRRDDLSDPKIKTKIIEAIKEAEKIL